MLHRLKGAHFVAIVFCFQLGCIKSYAEKQTFPKGHLQPLGSHRDPDPVEERSLDEIPTPLEFWNEFLMPSKAVVFRAAAKKSPGSWLWTDSYLKENYGNLEMRLEGKKEKDAKSPYPEGDLGLGRDTMRNFIDTYHNSGKYIVSELPKQMYHEASVLPFMGCSPYRDHIIEVDFWMNGNNASSIMHKDAFNQLNCLYNGTKIWKLIDYKYEDKIYKRYEDERQIGGFSMINVSAVDLLKYPKIAEVPWQRTVLNSGDCLFLPGSMYHQVQSYGSQNIAVSLLFKRFQFQESKNVDFSKCANKSLEFETLDKYEPDWIYPGEGMMSMGNSELESFAGMIPQFYTKKGKLSERKIHRFLAEIYPGPSEDSQQKAKQIYKKVSDLFGKNQLPAKESLLNKTAVREIGKELEPEEPSNSYNFEYGLIEAEDVVKILRIGIKEGNGRGSREHFTKLYREYLLGTEKFASKFLDTLIGSVAEFFTTEDLQKNLGKAIQPYYKYGKEPTPDPEPNYDAGEIEEAQKLEYDRRLKDINEADDPSVFDDVLPSNGGDNEIKDSQFLKEKFATESRDIEKKDEL